MALDMSAISRPIGPLPLWAWGALLGGGAILFASSRGGAAAKAVLDPNTATPAAPGDTGGGGPPIVDPGQGVGQPVSITDLLGGQGLGDFLHGLGPNYTQASITAGQLNATVQNSAQNYLDEQSLLAQYHSADVANSNFWAGQIANNQNFYNTITSFWHDYYNATGSAPWWMPTATNTTPWWFSPSTTPTPSAG